MKIGLDLSGGEELAARLRLLSAAVRRRALLKVLRVAAEPIRGRASELAPLDPTTARDIKESIVISATTQIGSVAGGGQWEADAADEFQAAVAVGPARGFFYGLFSEFGTVRQHAHPFMRPAFDYGGPRALTVLRMGLWDLIQDANENAGPFKSEDT